MRHWWTVFFFVWAFVTLGIAWFSGPEAFRSWVVEPVIGWRDSQRHLSVKLLELTEAPEIAAAGRRLLQPLGAVRLRRIFVLPTETPAPAEPASDLQGR